MSASAHRRTLGPALALGLALALTGAFAAAAQPPERSLVVGSKAFTESVILGEIVQQQLARHGLAARHRRQLGGSRVLFDALLRGEIDAYPEYTGTLTEELLARGPQAPPPAEQLGRLGLEIAVRLGFENTYVLGMRAAQARALGIASVSDLRRHPRLRLGFSSEFLQRADGWPGLQRHYGLPHRDVRGLAHELAYRAVAAGGLDVTDLYSTDPEIVQYGLAVLADDRGFFPEYAAILLVRADLPAAARAALQGLQGRIDTQAMARMNARATLERVPEALIAADFLREIDGQALAPRESTRAARIVRRTGEHLLLTGVSLLAAVLVGLPLGVLAARRPALARLVLGLTGMVQTIPALALLVFMIPLLGIGFTPAVVALFLYSLLPIVRNTCSGLQDIAPPLRESALALGLESGARLRLIELPLAVRSILAGIKTAAVINIGTATLGALIGAGGYGQPILAGIRLNDVALILEGAVPAAALALLAQGLFDALERLVLPRGLLAPASR